MTNERESPDASSSSETVVIENGERVYPCRCGHTHRGDYALVDWLHHNCFHDGVLWPIDIDGEPTQHYICSQCGKNFWLVRPVLQAEERS